MTDELRKEACPMCGRRPNKHLLDNTERAARTDAAIAANAEQDASIAEEGMATIPYADGSRWFASLLDTVETAVRDIPPNVPTECWCDTGDSFVREGKCLGCGHGGPHGDVCPAPSWRGISTKELRAAVLAEIGKLRTDPLIDPKP